MPERINLDQMSAPTRKTIDADWSPAKKKAVGVAAGVLSLAMLAAGGWWMFQLMPVSMPKNANEALAVMNSGKFANLDEARKRDYSEEAWRLIMQMSEEERRKLLRADENEEGRRRLMEQRMAESARRFARGQELEFPFGQGMRGPGDGRPGDGRGPGGPPGTGEQRPPQDEKTAEQRRQQMAGRIKDGIQTGNAQNIGLMGEMRKRMQGRGGPGGGNRGTGGGTQRGR